MNRIFSSIPLLIAVATAGCAGQTDDDELTASTEEALSSWFNVRCESRDHRFNRCDVDGRIVDVRVTRQLSDARCEEGRSWGYNRDSIWVDRGCRADFEVRVRGGGGSHDSERLECSSNDHRYRFCESRLSRVTGVRLIRQLSDARCEEGGSFGHERDGIWVDRGCRGIFEVRGRN